MTVIDIAELLGGARVLGRSVGSDLDLDRIVEEGLPSRSVEALLRHMEVGSAEMAALIPARTLRASLQRPRLSSEQSDRVARLARVFRLAEETFGSSRTARDWILRPNRSLGGRMPMKLVRRSSVACWWSGPWAAWLTACSMRGQARLRDDCAWSRRSVPTARAR